MSNPTTDNFKYFFNTQTWINEDNVPTMLKLFEYVKTKYEQLIEFAKFYNKNYYNMTARAFNTRDEYSIETAAREYYNTILSRQPGFPYSERQYAKNYHYCYVLTKTIEFLYKHKDTKDVVDHYKIYKDENDVVDRYKIYKRINSNSSKPVYQEPNDLHKMFEPLPDASQLSMSQLSRMRIPDIFFWLRPENRGLSRYIDRNDIIPDIGNHCNLKCDDPSDEGCCKKVTHAFNTIASNIKNTIASNFTPKIKEEKKKTAGGKTRNKNKKHYSRRCKNRKNKKSCKKPHK
jgi:hypothetical protein